MNALNKYHSQSETNIITFSLIGPFYSMSHPPLDARKPPKCNVSSGFQKVFSTSSGFQSAFSGSKNAAVEGFLYFVRIS
jgi:hypothetical protein